MIYFNIYLLCKVIKSAGGYRNDKTPIILVTGFFGAGKTTFIKHLLEQLPPAMKIAVVQNEYASAGIDTAELLSVERKFEVLEVINGSVFCVCLLASFIDSLAEFTDKYKPDLILIEASGLSDPIAIAEMMQHPLLAVRVYLSSVWCIVDALNYSKVSRMNTRLEHQVIIADMLLVNKTDIMEDEPHVLEKSLKNLNSDARILLTTYCRVPQKVFDEFAGQTAAIEKSMEHSNIEPAGRSDINTLVIRTSMKITLDGLHFFISEVEGSLIRMKGFVRIGKGRVIRVQSEFGQSRLSETGIYSGNTELIGLGWNITAGGFGKRFHEVRKSFSQAGNQGKIT